MSKIWEFLFSKARTQKNCYFRVVLRR